MSVRGQAPQNCRERGGLALVVDARLINACKCVTVTPCAPHNETIFLIPFTAADGLRRTIFGQRKAAKYITGSVLPWRTSKTPVGHIETNMHCTIESVSEQHCGRKWWWLTARDRALQRSSLGSGGRIRIVNLRTSELRPTNVGHLGQACAWGLESGAQPQPGS